MDLQDNGICFGDTAFNTPMANENQQEDSESIHLDSNGRLTFSPNDPSNPQNWSFARKVFLSFIAILLVVNATFASSGPSAVLSGISSSLHVSTTASSLTVTLFVLANAYGPLVWAPLSEHFGRQRVFQTTFALYVVFNFLCAFAPNFGALLAGRLLSGVFAREAMGLFTIAIFTGPTLGPVVAGFLQLKKDWRWFFYVLLWLGGATLPLVFMLPETRPNIVLLQKARRIRKQDPTQKDLQAPAEASGQGLGALFKTALTRPWRIFIDPIEICCAAYTALIYMLLYMLFAIYPLVFRQMRGWNAGVSELPLLGVVVGSIFGGCGVLYTTHTTHKKLATGHKSVPEDRLPLACVGAVLFPISMFWFAWTAQYNSIHWIVPTLAGVPLAASFLFVSVAYLNYIADCYGPYAASALAANAVCRAFCGAAAPLFTPYMFEALTVAGGGSLVAGLGCLLAVAPFVFVKYGAQIRARSKFASSVAASSE
ncbi:hypothetical protein CERZMDRAFT_115770 [Cercospora zeae-maydis SCOH1-5]|uniref:Major facilitator superfamily (MFS) profile domain-containing protein n=1 Tax=Cercospora zeae-maydis SCOH1-5 TaxID=717836 RepID=A0A6A6EXF7_9PEZI|nr:hypothetical protein CERZMDRAFT_115770 [Cercospora zeae-maydis SCOH1-5]